MRQCNAVSQSVIETHTFREHAHYFIYLVIVISMFDNVKSIKDCIHFFGLSALVLSREAMNAQCVAAVLSLV